MQLFTNKRAVSSPITTIRTSAFQILLKKPVLFFALIAIFCFQIFAGDTINFDSYTAGAALNGQDGWVWHDISNPDNVNDMKSITFSGSDNVAACTTYGVGEQFRPLISRSSTAELRWKWRTDATTAKGAFGPCSTMSESGGSWNAFRVRPTIDGSGNFNCKGAAFVNATTVAGWPKYGLNKWYYMRLYMNMTTNKYSLYLDSVSFAGTTETQLVNDSTMAHTAGLAVSKVGFKGNTGVGGKIYIDSIMWSDPWVAAPASPKIWTGASGSSWNTAGNWSPTGVPSGTDSVLFNTGSVACNLDVNRTVKTIQFTSGYSGTFTFNASCSLTVTGVVADFRSGANIVTNSASALQMTGTSAQALFPRSLDTLPMLIQNGSGGTTVQTLPLSTAGPLIIKQGTFDLNNLRADVAGFKSTGGTLSSGNDSLTIRLANADTANFSGLSALNPGTGTIVIKGEGTTVLFSHGSKTFNDLVLWSQNSGGDVTLKTIGTGTITMNSDLEFRYSKTNKPRWEFGLNNPDITVAGSIKDVLTGGSGQTPRVDMGTGTWTVQGSADIPNGYQINAGATMVLSGSGVQDFEIGTGSGGTGPMINHTGSGSVRLTSSQTYQSFSQSAGTLDLNSYTLTLASSNTVSVSGGTLGGAGTVNSPLSIESSATLAPGGVSGIGKVNTSGTGTATLAAGATFSVGINGNTTAGTDYDQLNVVGTVTLGATLSIALGYAPADGHAYSIISNDGTDAITDVFSGLAQGATTSASYNSVSYDFTISYTGGDGNDVVLTYQPSCTPPSVTANPSNASVTAGQQASFTVTGNGTPTLLYQWQRSNDAGANWAAITGANAATYAFTTAPGDNGAQFRAIVTSDASCNAPATSTAAILTVCTPPSVTTNPSNASVTAGQQASFTVTGDGTPTLLYQWQRSNDAGANWAVITGANAATYAFTTAPGDNGAQFRAIVTSDASCTTPATSTAAILTVCTPPSVTTNPSNASVIAGQQASFTVAASGTPTLSYQWHRSNDAGANWAVITGANAATYAFTTASGDNGAQFRAIVTSDASCNAPATSTAAILTVCTPPSVTTNPSNASVIAGQQASFTVAASGTPTLSYQWHRSNDAGANWAVITGANAATYAFTTASGDNGAQFRAIVTSDASCNAPATSTAAILTVCTPPSVTTNPSNASVTAGQQASFTIAASGTPTLSYQWQRSNDAGANWAVITSANAATYVFITASADNGAQFRAVVTTTASCNIADTSTAATLTVCTPQSISSHPASQSKIAGETATFTVGAGGSGILSYLWERSNDAGATWSTITSATAPTYEYTVLRTDSDPLFRVTVSSNSTCNTPVTSNSALLSVCAPPLVDIDPSTQDVIADSAASFTVAANGTGLTYKWQSTRSGAWADESGQTGTTFAFVSALTDSGDSVRAVVTGNCGSVTSAIASIIVRTQCIAPTITAQPASQTAVTSGTNAVFTVGASGTSPLYQWATNGSGSWQNIAGANLASYQVAASSANDGHWFRATVSGVCGTAQTSDSAQLTVCYPPSVSNPDSQSVPENQTATFSVSGAGSPILTYAWQRSNDLGSTWTPIAGITTASYTIATTQTSDSGAQFRAIVSSTSPCGAPPATSASATLSVTTVTTVPVISLEPRDTTAADGMPVSFTVAATGTIPLTYRWLKNGTDSLGSDPTLSIVAEKADSGHYVICIISNVAGADTSRKAYMHVGAAYSAPVITIHPLGKNVFEGQPVSFTVAATGNPAPAYQWVKNGTPVTGATAATFSITAALVSDNGARIVCLVSNSLSPQGISSDTVTLTVESKPTARFFAKPELGDAPLQVTFTDSSTGIILSRIWYFGDNTTDTSRNPIHTYANPGQYTVTLKVSNPGGTDSLTRSDYIWAYAPGSNKARLTGRYLLNDKVEITITNLRALTYAFPPPWTDSMGIWFAPGAAPTILASATRLKLYPKADLQKSDTLIDTLSVSTTDSIAGFSSAIYRNDRSLSTVSPGNSFTVLLRDTVRPVNALALSGMYIGGDTANIILDSTGSIDTARIDSVCIWFDRSGIAPAFGSANATWISAAQIAASDKYTHRVISPLFSGEQKQIVCAVIQKGKNGLLSPVKTATFTVGKARPVNTVRLRAEAIGATRIQLSWNHIEGISHIRIWKGITPVPSDNVPVASFDTLPVRSSDTTFIVTGLNPTTRYYFGAQILRDGQWSDIPDSAKAQAQTPEPSDTTRIPNVAVLTSLTFDTLSATIQVGWRIDTTAFQNLELGIAYAHRGYPLDALGPQILILSERSGTTTLRTKGDIRFDTTYFINLWLRKPEGIWAVPSDSGYDTLRTPKFTRQIVSFFSAQRDYDTVSAFNGTVILSKGPEFPKMNQSTDTIVAYRLATAPPGMVAVGTGFTFSKKEPTAPFTIGLAYTPIPAGYSASQIRMYRDSAGVLLLEHNSTIDSVHKVVTVTTSNLEFPFLLMIDTQRPAFEFISNVAGIVDAASDLHDTVVLSDNIGNLHWSFLYSRGDEPPVIQQGTTGYLHALRDTLQLLVPSSSRAISQDFGLRALLIISDGVHVDTINCSRQVYRDRSDEVTTVQQQWYPLSVTAQLTHVRPESLLTTMVGKDSTWKYDNRYFRLFRWVTTPDNETADKRWVEYSEQTLPLFSFTPGRLIWIKTRENKQISFGKGVTLSLKDTALIPLAASDWTDIALPYRFSIMLGDILDATGKIGDSLIVYSWHKDSTSKKFTTAPLFAAEFPDRRDRAVVMNYKAGTGFTIYNSLDSAVTLRVPPTPISMSKVLQQPKPKKMRTDSWSIKVITRTTAGDAMPDVYCGYTPGVGKPVFYPSPPTFLSTRVMVYDRAGQRRYGHCMRHGAVDGAYVYEIAFVNESDKPENFRFNLAATGDVPDKIEPFILDPTAKIWAQGGNITVAAHSVELRWLVASNQDYRDRFSSRIESWKYALQLVYPNPFHSLVHARYSIPAGSEGTVRFSIHDVVGREVWRRELAGTANAGPGTITWDGKSNAKRKVSAGSYIFRMFVIDKKGRKIHSFNTRLTYIPK